MVALLIAFLALLIGAAPAGSEAALQGPDDGYEVVAEYPHDPQAYTQGLDFEKKALFESTGLYGESSLRKVDLETGDVLRRKDLAAKHFGEGIAVLGSRIYQLTFESEKAFVYKKKTFQRIKVFGYEGEGWGLTYNGRRLIMSNGTDVLQFREPDSFEIKRTVAVTDAGEPVGMLNELEWVEGEIFANIYQSDDVVRIDPGTGEVLGRIDLSALREKEAEQGEVDVTNGIAYMASDDRLFVTGKLWAHVYEIELVGE